MFTNSISVNLPQDLDEYSRYETEEAPNTINVNFHTTYSTIHAIVDINDKVIDTLFEILNEGNVNIIENWDECSRLIDRDYILQLFKSHIEVLLGDISIIDGNFEDNGIEDDANINVIILKEFKPIWLRKKPDSCLNNYKEWKKNTLGMNVNDFIKSKDLRTYLNEDNFHITTYEPGCPWYHYIQDNTTM